MSNLKELYNKEIVGGIYDWKNLSRWINSF